MSHRKPTPRDIANFMTEDDFGLPIMNQTPQAGDADETTNMAPEFDQGNGPNQEQQPCTEMRQCAATGCSYNNQGGCTLDSIDINEHGGCAQYEASADGVVDDDDGRYTEQDAGVNGDVDSAKLPNQHSQNVEDRHWQTNKWDPRGGGY